MWPLLSREATLSFFLPLMDLSLVVTGAIGFVLAWCFKSEKTHIQQDRPCNCQCTCANPDHTPATNWELIGALAVIFAALVLGLALVVKSVFRTEAVEFPTFAFSTKGKSGKGIFGARKGLQILDG